jgi:hypothetical protein
VNNIPASRALRQQRSNPTETCHETVGRSRENFFVPAAVCPPAGGRARVGGLPRWGYSRSWGYGPSGLLGTIVIILLILWLLGRL